MKHELKTWPEAFHGTKFMGKTFEVRRNDREFAVGDELRLMEWDPTTEQYTGEEISAIVTYLIDLEPFVHDNFVGMSVAIKSTW